MIGSHRSNIEIPRGGDLTIAGKPAFWIMQPDIAAAVLGCEPEDLEHISDRGKCLLVNYVLHTEGIPVRFGEVQDVVIFIALDAVPMPGVGPPAMAQLELF